MLRRLRTLPSSRDCQRPTSHHHGRQELARLRAAMKQETEGTAEQDEAIGEVAKAEKAAGEGDGPTVLRHLKTAGTWTLGVAEKIGVPLAVEAMKRMM